MSGEPIALTANLTPLAVEALAAAAEYDGSSLTDTVCHALMVYRSLQLDIVEGRLYAQRPDGGFERIRMRDANYSGEGQ